MDELRQEKAKLERDFEKLNEEHERLKDKLVRQIAECVQAIRSKITSDLEASASTLESMLLQGTNVNEKVNTIVRCAVVTTLQTKLEPQVKRYLRDIESTIDGFSCDSAKVELDKLTLETDDQISSNLEAVLVPLASSLATFAVGALAGAKYGAILGPVGAAIGALAGTLATSFIRRGKQEKQEAERKEIARQRVQELIASVSEDAGAKAEAGITSYIEEVTEQVGAEIQNRSDLVRKAIAAAEEKITANREQKAAEQAMLTEDLNRIRGIIYGN